MTSVASIARSAIRDPDRDQHGVRGGRDPPTLIMLPPVNQFRTEYVFLSPNKYVEDYVNIVAPIDAEVRIDDVLLLEAAYTPVGSSWRVAFSTSNNSDFTSSILEG